MASKHVIRLPVEQVEEAKRAVAAGRAASVSAYVSAALAEKAADDALIRVLAEMDAEYGEPAAEHYAWARRVLGLT